MKNFQSVLFVQTETIVAKPLAEVTQIHTIPDLFAISPLHDYIYAYDGSLITYTTVPFSKISQSNYTEKPIDMLATKEMLYVLTNDALICHAHSNFQMIRGEFLDGKLISLPGMPSGVIGIQKAAALEIYDVNLRRTATYHCQASFYTKEVLILGDYNILKIMRGDKQCSEIIMPDSIIVIFADPLLSRIYCSCKDGAIYALSTTGQMLYKLVYHDSPVTFMDVSFCGRFLFAADAHKIIVVDTHKQTIVDFAIYESAIKGLSIVVEGNRVFANEPIKIA